MCVCVVLQKEVSSSSQWAHLHAEGMLQFMFDI